MTRGEIDEVKEKPVATYHFDRDSISGRIICVGVTDAEGHRHAIPRTTVQPNQNAVNDQLARLEEVGVTDLYAERMQRLKQGQTACLHGAEQESVDSLTKAASDPDVNDMFRERMLKRRQR